MRIERFICSQIKQLVDKYSFDSAEALNIANTIVCVDPFIK